MAVLGVRQLIDIAIPTGIDGAAIFREALKSGMTGEEAIRTAAAAVGVANERVRSRFGGFSHFTNELYAMNRNGSGSARRTPEKAEGAINDPVRSLQIGHMLPLKPYQDVLGWSWEYLKKASLALLRGDVAEVAEAWENRVAYEFWTRVLTNTENAIGSGYDVPWAIGTGTNVNFIPPQFGNNTFDSTHSHFNFHDANSVTWATAAALAMLDLRHHGHTGRVSLTISSADVGSFQTSAAGSFARLTPNNFVYVGGNTSTPVAYSPGSIEGVSGELIGYLMSDWGEAEVRYDESIPTNYAFMTKSYGVDNPRNGVAIREDEDYGGFGMYVRPILESTPERDLEYLKCDAALGVGINDRTNGVAIYRAAGAVAWVNPTIS